MSEDTEKFLTPEECLQVVEDMEKAHRDLSASRAKINNQFNGGYPYTPEQAEKMQISWNANFLYGYTKAIDANLQVNGALLYKDKFFTARCIKGKPEKRDAWTRIVTDNLHKPMKDGYSGQDHMFLMRNRNAALTLHGIGPMVWMNDYRLLPEFVALDDLLIPTDTPLNMRNALGQFGVNVSITAWELSKRTMVEKSDKGWSKELALELVRHLSKQKDGTASFDQWDNPEKVESYCKQHATWLNSDSVPRLKLTYFFHQSEKDGKWYRKIIVREQESIGQIAVKDKFLYESDTPFADDISQILHIQFGDGSVVAPLKYHSVRGLGMLLFSVVEAMNRMQCQLFHHVFEQMMTLFRISDPTDRDRPKQIQMFPYGIVERGVEIVPKEQRHQIDSRVVEMAQAQARQILSESSSSYVQDLDSGTAKERTATEAQIMLQSTNKIVSSMLQSMFLQEGFYYQEVFRRAMKPHSQDPQVIKFQKACIDAGVPKELMKPECWEIHVEKVFGGGDQTLAQQEANWLLSNSQRYDPSAQRVILRKATETIIRDPDLAKVLVPDDPNQATEGRIVAEDAWGTLMEGIPITLREGIEHKDYVDAMMGMIDATVTNIKNTDNVGTPREVRGLDLAAQDVGKHLELMGQQPENREYVAAIGKALGKIMNDVKAFAQRQQEQRDKTMPDPEAQAKAMATAQAAQQKQEINQANFLQKQQQSEIKFQMKLDQDRKEFAMEMEKLKAETMAEIQAQAMKAGQQLQIEREKAEAQIAAMKEKAAAQPAPKPASQQA